ncbi:hypothetical protein QCA50_001981 [Cerrena zonata]|uniref:Seipin n=1 Tax=Cerrena zonata TaxID=2478898 RepID=A0AAW0GN69_9APHY
MISSTIRLIKPLAPHLIPLVVFALAIPVVIALSLSAGWFVWRSIAVGWELPLYLQYGDGPPPYAVIHLPNMLAQQPYDISLHLVVPSTDTNYALGNFMSTLTLFTPANNTLATIRRPAIVMPNSWWRSFVSPGVVVLDIPLLSEFRSTSNNVLARIELGRQDHWRSLANGEGRELSVSSALLRGVVVHKGLRGIITRFPLFTAMISSGVFLFISFVILATCLLPAIEWRFHRESNETESDDDRYTSRPIKSEWSERRRGKAPRRSRSATTPRLDSYEFKAEDDIVSIPSAASAPSPLRRRRSRLSQSSDGDE